MRVSDLISRLDIGSFSFPETIAVIDEFYAFTPVAFVNGDQHNAAGTNNGSCKIFAFGQLNNLSEQATLNAFGDFYRKDVLENPEGSDHANIRNFMKTGWSGLQFEGEALKPA